MSERLRQRGGWFSDAATKAAQALTGLRTSERDLLVRNGDEGSWPRLARRSRRHPDGPNGQTRRGRRAVSQGWSTTFAAGARAHPGEGGPGRAGTAVAHRVRTGGSHQRARRCVRLGAATGVRRVARGPGVNHRKIRTLATCWRTPAAPGIIAADLNT